MSKISLPHFVEGKWIWNSSLSSGAGTFLLMRQCFQINAPGMDNRLWITSSGAYQLFVNEHFIGFGPRARQGDRFCVDMYEISGELQSGSNAVSVIVYDDPMLVRDARHVPGMWCQVECDGRIRLKSDETWQIRNGSFMMTPRPRLCEGQRLTEYINNSDVPEHWTRAMYIPGGGWHAPDSCVDADGSGVTLTIHPLTPAMAGIPVDFTAGDHGKVVAEQAWTQVNFSTRHRNGSAACAAETYCYCNEPRETTVRISADEPFRFFCNGTELLAANAAYGETLLPLSLKAGWNRLLAVQTPGMSSMGIFLLFPELKKNEILWQTEPVEKGRPGWSVAGPLKLPLADATFSLKFERIPHGVYLPPEDVPMDQFLRLENAVLQADDSCSDPMTLRKGEYLRLSLDVLRYGYPVLMLDAGEGDEIDLAIGSCRSENGLPFYGERMRSTHRLRCRRGENCFRLFFPNEIMEILIHVRKASGKVRLLECYCEELNREPVHTTKFFSSEPLLDRLWNIGLNTLRRSSAFVPPLDVRTEHVTYLVDAYMDAVNMVATFGDNEYSATRLKQFADAQFENGDIPALSFAGGSRPQVPHLFFFPVWMSYNYRISGDLEALKALEPCLDQLLDFFYSLVDDEVGLIGDLDERLQLDSRLSIGKFSRESFPTYLNALFCLALISSADVFCSLHREGDADSALADASEIAARLRERNFDPEIHLFRRKTERNFGDEAIEHNLFANFMTLVGGLMQPDEFEIFFKTYFNEEPPFDRSEEARNPYFHFFFMETMFSLGKKEWACRYLLDYWSSRFCETSGSWLTWQGTPSAAALSFQNGNLVSPNIFLVREIAGIRAADPAFSSVYLSPALDMAQWIDMTLPTVSGNIRIRWEKLPDGGLDILIESTYPLRVLPEFTPELLSRTGFTLSENVTLLQREASRT